MHGPDEKKIYLNTFEIARPCISSLMPKFLVAINENELVNKKLFQINFRANSKNEVMTTIVYHKKLTKDLSERVQQVHADNNLSQRRLLVRIILFQEIERMNETCVLLKLFYAKNVLILVGEAERFYFYLQCNLVQTTALPSRLRHG